MMYDCYTTQGHAVVAGPVSCVCMQVFVANPNKTRPIIEILVGNKDKLLKYLTDFHSDKGMRWRKLHLPSSFQHV